MKPLFIGGCPRSGTTLLGSLVGAHPKAVCIPEMPFKINLLRELPWEEGPIDGSRIASFMAGRRKARAWGVDWQDPSGPYPPHRRFDYRTAVEAAVSAYASPRGRQDAEVFTDHTPYNIRHVGELLRAFPDAHFVHLIRDGRGVAASLLQCDFGPDTVLGIASYWPMWIAFGLTAELRFADRVHRVHYEDLLREPMDLVGGLTEAIGFGDPPPSDRGTFPPPRHTSREHRLVDEPPDPARAEAWRDELSWRDIEVLEYELRELLEQLGYELAARHPVKRPKLRYRIRDSSRALRAPWRRLRNRLKFALAYRDTGRKSQ